MQYAEKDCRKQKVLKNEENARISVIWDDSGMFWACGDVPYLQALITDFSCLISHEIYLNGLWEVAFSDIG